MASEQVEVCKLKNKSIKWADACVSSLGWLWSLVVAADVVLVWVQVVWTHRKERLGLLFDHFRWCCCLVSRWEDREVTATQGVYSTTSKWASANCMGGVRWFCTRARMTVSGWLFLDDLWFMNWHWRCMVDMEMWGAGAVCLLRCAACLHSFCIDLSMCNKSGTDKSPLFAAWQQILLKEMF